jgi:hypothetical protein
VYWEADIRKLFELGSSGPAWATYQDPVAVVKQTTLHHHHHHQRQRQKERKEEEEDTKPTFMLISFI